MIDYIKNLAKERSTWLGLIGVIGSLGYAVNPIYIDMIVNVGIGLSGLVLTLTRDKAE